MAKVWQKNLTPEWLKLQEGWRIRKRRQRLRERLAREAAKLHPEGYRGPAQVPSGD
jgi:hypothetical protein